MKKHTISIVDDEPLARQRIRRMLQGKTNIQIISECKNGEEAIQKLRVNCPDLLFLDIQLKDFTGFDVLDQIGQAPGVVIFITSYDEYAIKAFEYCALDYLLKPIMPSRFNRAFERAVQQLEKGVNQSTTDNLKKLLGYIESKKESKNNLLSNRTLPIRIGDRIQLIPIHSIHYFIASNGYIEVYSQEKKHLLRDNFSNLLSKLPANQFQRIHRSYCINLQFLTEIKHLSFGSIEVKMKDGKSLKVSKSYKSELIEKIGL